MMQIDYWEYIFNNWFVFFGVMLTIIIILTSIVVRIVVSRIQTKVWYFQKNSVDEYKATEEKGQVLFNKMSVLRKKDPYIRKHGWRVQRMFLVQQNRKQTLDFRQIKPSPEKDRIMWESIVESQAITQFVRGLLKTAKTILIYLAAGACIGFLISQLIFTFG